MPFIYLYFCNNCVFLFDWTSKINSFSFLLVLFFKRGTKWWNIEHYAKIKNQVSYQEEFKSTKGGNEGRRRKIISTNDAVTRVTQRKNQNGCIEILKTWLQKQNTACIQVKLRQDSYETRGWGFHSSLSHQVTQEELHICPSHAAATANYPDLKCALAAIGGDARCYCINLLAPAVVS